MRRRGAAAVLVAAALAGSCSTDPAPDPDAGPSPTATPSPGPSTTPAAPPTPQPRPRPFTLAVAGDVHLEGPLRARLEADPATTLAPAFGALAEADLAVVNLETSVGRGGRPEPGKRFVFTAPPAALTALAAAGVDVATMANNHALDVGRGVLTGPDGTLAAARAAAAADPPLDVVGVGRDAAQAFAPAVREVRGSRVAVLGATVAGADPTADPTGQWAATDDRPGTADALDPTRLLAAVRSADRGADVVVTYLHWGVQGESCPDDRQRSLARRLVDAGADVVVGSHAHVLQGDGRLGPAYVAYGLGNHAWYTPSTTTTLTLTVRPPTAPGGRARVVAVDRAPARTGADGLPAPLRDAEAQAVLDDVRRLRSCAGLAAP
ncbi:CapA family protein [Nocardioides litoris]|uniref:CapA family protein n=1 Tax=Nocardioides litoris TaxID=1926648 RepID=UPI0011215294|nr:CapA family protein [Nocardioides litoris]